MADVSYNTAAPVITDGVDAIKNMRQGMACRQRIEEIATIR